MQEGRGSLGVAECGQRLGGDGHCAAVTPIGAAKFERHAAGVLAVAGGQQDLGFAHLGCDGRAAALAAFDQVERLIVAAKADTSACAW